VTYCVSLLTAEGLVFLSDTRTNAGPDNIAAFTKLHVIAPGDRVMGLMTLGNLAVTQAVVTRVTEGLSDSGDQLETLYTTHSMFQAARLVGDAVREVYHRDGEALQAQGLGFDAAFILGGQIAGRRMRVFLVYSAGNFIEIMGDTPYVQIGETKYGKPILDRAMSFETPLEQAIKLGLISMDSTLRSNFSVGAPIDLMVYRRDALVVGLQRRISEDDPYFRMIREGWSDALRRAYHELPAPPWLAGA
jgi:putative proteasome-type protease